jgi:short-subunit dehydrogenase
MNNKVVLITGASSGIGLEFAKLFAKDNYDLVLVARDSTKLAEAAKLLEKSGSSVTYISKDLSDPCAPLEIYEQLRKEKIVIDCLVNNAGFATYGYFNDLDVEEELKELQVNIVATTYLTKLFLKDMVEKNSGRILHISSTGAFLPGPLMAVYFASKSYVLSFSEALSAELEGTNVTVTALCPGPTKTNFIRRASLGESPLFQRNVMAATDVARIGIGD